ncbi:MAG: hypothetical protein JO254_07060 [Pseudolabrys sp.]|nr:hypothetical protein [Pseudolabrys sp.]
MKKLTLCLAAASFIAAGSLPTIAFADYNGGGPVMKGKMCWMATTGNDQGRWADCPKPMKPAKMKMKKKM